MPYCIERKGRQHMATLLRTRTGPLQFDLARLEQDADAILGYHQLVIGWGLALFAFGTTLPYAAVFDEAGHIGAESALGPGTAQGVVSVISAPASAFGPPLIGALLGHTGDFALPFGAMGLVGAVALIAALPVGPILARTRMGEDLSRLRERDLDAYLSQALASRSRVSLHAST